MEDLTIIIINRNGMDYLPETMATIFGQIEDHTPVILVDDASDDCSLQWVRQNYPTVQIVAFSENTANMCINRNAGLAHVTTRFVFISDNDIRPKENCLESLIHALRTDDDACAATPRLVFSSDESILYSDGNNIHFLGLSLQSKRGLPSRQFPDMSPRLTANGGIMMLDLNRLEAVGHFDEGYLRGWSNDGELQLRCRLIGKKAIHVPQAVAAHVEKEHGFSRAPGQLNNRYRFIFTYYRLRTLLLLAPSLLVFEIALTAVSVVGGFGRERFRVLASLWATRDELLRRRRHIQSIRVVNDNVLLNGGPFELPAALPKTGPMAKAFAVFGAILNCNWLLVRRWV